MATVKLPDVQLPDAGLKEQIAYLTDIVQQYKKNLEYYINNLDGSNIIAGSITVGVAQITDSLVVGVNVGIGETLTPVEQAIAEKRRVFTAQPVPPYDVKDLWVDGTDLYVCQFTRIPPQTFNEADWIVATGYKTATGVVSIINGTVTADFINAIGIDAEYINAGIITGSTLRTTSSGKRIEISSTGNSVNIYNTAGVLAGQIDWDNSGAGTTEEATERLFIRSLNNVALKLESSAGLSIEAPDIWFNGTMHGITVVGKFA